MTSIGCLLAALLLFTPASHGQQTAEPPMADAEVLEKLPELPDDELRSLFQIYHRLDNAKMRKAVLTEAGRRSPALGKELESFQTGSDPRVARILALQANGRYAEAASQLEKLRAEDYPNARFPYELDLAYAYSAGDGGSRNYAKAKSSFRRVVDTAGFSQQERNDARTALHNISVDEACAEIYGLVQKGRAEDALSKADKHLAAYPNEWRVRLAHAEALGANRRIPESKSSLEALLADSGPSSSAKRQISRALHALRIDEACDEIYRLMDETRPAMAMARAEYHLAQLPDEWRIQLAYGDVLAANGRAAEALPLLQRIKSEHYADRPFPAESSIGKSYFELGEFDLAHQSFVSLADDPTVTPATRNYANDMAVELQKRLSSYSASRVNFIDLEEGTAWYYGHEVSLLVAPRLRAGLRGHYHDIDLSDSRSILASGGDAYSVSAFARQLFDGAHFVEGRAGGGSNDDLTAGVTLGKEYLLGNSMSYDIGFDYKAQQTLDFNTLSTEALQLLVLDGTETRIAGGVAGPITNSGLGYSVRAYGKTIYADEINIGDAYGGELLLSQRLVETDGGSLYLTYGGEVQRFSAEPLSAAELSRLGANPFTDSNLATNFVREEYYTQAVELYGTFHISKEVSLIGSATVLYEFDASEFIYEFNAGMNKRMGDWGDLSIGAAYSSSSGGGSNRVNSGDIVYGTAGLKIYF